MKPFLAPAKINLHLRVTGIRDDGYHELDTSFVYVDVFDELTIEPAEHLTVHCSNPALDGEKNLVFKVLKALADRYGIAGGLSVRINKQLPEQAGLGGGSSDAATALLAANDIWNLKLSTAELIDFAAPFGADIPCFLFGEASRAAGVGEKLEPYSGSMPEGSLLLAWPGSGLSTPEVFRHYDLTLSGQADTIRADLTAALGENDLEASACALSGDVSRLLSHLRNSAQQAWMSGSGSSCVAVFRSREDAEAEAVRLSDLGLASWTHVGKLLREHPFRNQF